MANSNHRYARGGQTRGGLLQTKKFFVKNAIKTEFKRNFKKGGRKFPTDLGPCLGMMPVASQLENPNPGYVPEHNAILMFKVTL